MEPVVPSVPDNMGGGNTNSPPITCLKQKDNASYRWCFTLNNYTADELNEIEKWCSANCAKYIIGEEVGEKGTPHLQGYINLKKKMRFITLKNLWPKFHLERTRKDEQTNINYCSKDGKYKTNIKMPVKVKVLDDSKLRPFQKWIIGLRDKPVDEGKIIWIYDPKGQMGKTETLRYLYVNYGVPFAYGGKCSDIINLAFNNKEYLISEEKPMFLYNIPRETTNDKISYNSMEQISDGAIANTKFEAGCFVFNKPIICVLANCKPLINKLTRSRWIIKTINDNFEIEDLLFENNDIEL